MIWIVLADDYPVFDFTVLCWWWHALRFFAKKFVVQCKPFIFFLLNNLRYCQSERTDSKTRSPAFNMKNSQMVEGSRNNRAPIHSPVFTIEEDVTH